MVLLTVWMWTSAHGPRACSGRPCGQGMKRSPRPRPGRAFSACTLGAFDCHSALPGSCHHLTTDGHPGSQRRRAHWRPRRAGAGAGHRAHAWASPTKTRLCLGVDMSTPGENQALGIPFPSPQVLPSTASCTPHPPSLQVQKLSLKIGSSTQSGGPGWKTPWGEAGVAGRMKKPLAHCCQGAFWGAPDCEHQCPCCTWPSGQPRSPPSRRPGPWALHEGTFPWGNGRLGSGTQTAPSLWPYEKGLHLLEPPCLQLHPELGE